MHKNPHEFTSNHLPEVQNVRHFFLLRLCKRNSSVKFALNLKYELHHFCNYKLLTVFVQLA